MTDIKTLEAQARRLLLQAIALFDPRTGGRAFRNFGRDGRANLTPRMGAEIEFLAWPGQGYDFQYINRFLADLDERVYVPGTGPGTGRRVRALSLYANHRFRQARFLDRIARVYQEPGSGTCGEVTLAHDHPKTLGSPHALTLLIPRIMAAIKTSAPAYADHVDFRAYPEPSAVEMALVEQQLGVYRKAHEYHHMRPDPAYPGHGLRFIGHNSLQVSVSFAAASGGRIASTPRDYAEGDTYHWADEAALHAHAMDVIRDMDEHYLGLGFDMTERHRHGWLNTPGGPHKAHGRPFKLKGSRHEMRIENGMLSPTGLSGVSILCNLVGSYAALRDKVSAMNGDVIVAPYELPERVVAPGQGTSTITRPDGQRIDLVLTGPKPTPRPLATDYDAMLQQARRATLLRVVVDEVSGQRLGTALHAALIARAEAIMEQTAKGAWHYQRLPQPPMPA